MAASLGAAVLDLGADVKSLEHDMGRAEGATKNILGRIQSSIRNVFEIALGNIVARGFAALTDGIRSFGQQALVAVGNAQRLEMSLKGLLTDALMYEQTADRQIEQVRTFGEAQALAKVQVRDMLDYVEKLAIQSPFEQSQVEMITKIGLGAHMTTEQIKEFTGAFLDYSAAHGLAAGDLAFAAEQFLQLKKAGKLLTIDLRQLRRLGIDVDRILGAKMGMSVEEFNKKVEQSPELMDQLFASFVEMAKETSSGAAAEMATSIDGMMATLGDIVEIGSRKLFRPIVEAVSPTISSVLDKLAGLVTGGKAEELGNRLGAALSQGIQGIQTIAGGDTDKGFFEVGAAIAKVFGLEAGNRIVSLRDRFDEVKASVLSFADTVRDSAGMALQWFTVNLLPRLREGLAWVKENIQPIVAGMAGFVGTLLGASAVVGVIGAIGAVLATITSPIFLIAAAVGLLAAAWQQNWGGIREKVATAWAAIQPVLQQLIEWLQVNVPIAIDRLVTFWNNTLQPAFQGFAAFLTGTWWPLLSSVFSGLVGYFTSAWQTAQDLWAVLKAVGAFIAGAFSAAWSGLVAVWQGVVQPVIQAIAAHFRDYVLPVLEQIALLVRDGLALAGTIAAGIWQNVLWPALQAVGAYMMATLQPVFEAFQPVFDALKDTAQIFGDVWRDTVLPALKDVVEFVKSDLKPKFKELGEFLGGKISETIAWFGETVLPKIRKGFDGIRDAIQWVIDKIKDFREKLNSIKDNLPWWMTPGSPTPMELGLLGIGEALDQLARERLPDLAANLNLGVRGPQLPVLGGLSGAVPAGAGVTGGDIHLHFEGVEINNGMDLDRLTQHVVQEIQRHQRGGI